MLRMGGAVFALGDIIRAYDFAVLTVSLLALIDIHNPVISRFSVCSSTAWEGALAMMYLSPSKSLGVVLIELVGSLMYKRNNNGPKTEPCVTPYLICSMAVTTLGGVPVQASIMGPPFFDNIFFII